VYATADVQSSWNSRFEGYGLSITAIWPGILNLCEGNHGKRGGKAVEDNAENLPRWSIAPYFHRG